MSYVPASESRDLMVVLGGVAALIGSLQWWSMRSKADPGRVIAVCADGSVIGAWDGQVRHRPRRRGFGARLRDLARRRRPARVAVPAREDLAPGDLGFLRVREGRAGEAAWIVEGLDLGPEPYGLHWEFDTPEQALAADALLRERVVRAPREADGLPRTLTEAEFDAFWAVSVPGPGAA